MFRDKMVGKGSERPGGCNSCDKGRGACRGALQKIMSGCAMAIAFVLGAPVVSHAAQLGLLLTVPSLFDEAILIVAVIALLGAIRVYGSVKGGLLAKSWQFFVLGIICLVIAQLFQLADTAGYFQAPELLRPVTLTAMAGLFLLGVLKARRTLS